MGDEPRPLAAIAQVKKEVLVLSDEFFIFFDRDKNNKYQQTLSVFIAAAFLGQDRATG